MLSYNQRWSHQPNTSEQAKLLHSITCQSWFRKMYMGVHTKFTIWQLLSYCKFCIHTSNCRFKKPQFDNRYTIVHPKSPTSNAFSTLIVLLGFIFLYTQVDHLPISIWFFFLRRNINSDRWSIFYILTSYDFHIFPKPFPKNYLLIRIFPIGWSYFLKHNSNLIAEK